MKDRRYFDLRCLTENIFYIREYVLKFLDPSSNSYKEVSKLYEELWNQRDELEHNIFGEE